MAAVSLVALSSSHELLTQPLTPSGTRWTYAVLANRKIAIWLAKAPRNP